MPAVPASPSASESRGAALEPFRDAARRGDTLEFVVLVAEAFSVCAGVEWPLCDSCMEASLKAKQKELQKACEERDAVSTLEASVRASVLARQSAVVHSHTRDAGGENAGCENVSRELASPRQLTVLTGDELMHPQYPDAHRAAVTAALAALDAEEAALEDALTQAHARMTAVESAEEHLDAYEDALDALEAAAWMEYMATSRAIGVTRDRMNLLRDRDLRSRDFMSKLRYVSVHNDAFFIWHRGPFVTMNGCRLGRLPAQSVEWTEINAALGQTALLLSTVATRVGFSFQKYRIIPLGSFSRIAAIGDEKTTYELFYDNKYFASRRLNYALKAMAYCIGELGEFAQQKDESFRLPYPITHGGEKVADLQVTLGKEAQWTRAMKCALTNLKWLLAWAYRQPE